MVVGGQQKRSRKQQVPEASASVILPQPERKKNGILRSFNFMTSFSWSPSLLPKHQPEETRHCCLLPLPLEAPALPLFPKVLSRSVPAPRLLLVCLSCLVGTVSCSEIPHHVSEDLMHIPSLVSLSFLTLTHQDLFSHYCGPRSGGAVVLPGECGFSVAHLPPEDTLRAWCGCKTEER